MSGPIGFPREKVHSHVSGTFTANGQTLELDLPKIASSVGVQIAGTWSGQIEFEATIDGTNWVAHGLHNGVDSVNATAGNGLFESPCGGFHTIRLRVSAWTSGTANVSVHSSTGVHGVDLTSPIPTGSNTVGKVGLSEYTPVSGRLPVDPSGVTSPVAVVSIVPVDITDEAARDLGKVDIASLDQYTPVSGRLPVDPSGVTCPVSLATLPTAGGKTLTYVSVAQGAAGTTQLAAASASNRHKILGCVLTLSAAGTLKFLDSSGDLTGAMDIAASGGFVIPMSLFPMMVTGAVNRSISITTTGGAAKGIVVLLTEP